MQGCSNRDSFRNLFMKLKVLPLPSQYLFSLFFVIKNRNQYTVNPLNSELNPICYLLALLGADHFLHVSRIRVKSLTLRLLMLACWDLGFKSHRGHGYLSVVSVVCCQVEVSATSWSLVQRSPTDCGASCVI